MDERSDIEKLGEAEQYKLQAEFILHKLQANVQVYGTNSAWTAADPADVPLALKYIDRSLENFPDNPAYLNLKALLLIEGSDDREQGMRLMERAAQLAPRDITIQDNLEKLKTAQASQCFIATAAFGTSMTPEISTLRKWRDEKLLTTRRGRWIVTQYYRISPPIAAWVARNTAVRAMIRMALRLLLKYLGRS
jgi:tetratricopeptide (TPR) repeat protein